MPWKICFSREDRTGVLVFSNEEDKRGEERMDFEFCKKRKKEKFV